jgi:hypothetical protein
MRSKDVTCLPVVFVKHLPLIESNPRKLVGQLTRHIGTMLKVSRIVFTLLLMNFSVLTQGQTVSSPEPGCEFPDSVRHSRPGIGQGATEIRVGVYPIVA